MNLREFLTRSVCFALLLLITGGCATTEPLVVRPLGTTVSVGMFTGDEYTGELVVFGDTIVVRTSTTVVVLPSASVRELRIQGWPGRDWMAHSFLVHVAPGAAATFTELPMWVSGAMTGLGVVTWLMMDLTEPPSLITAPFDDKDLERISHLARYPFGAPPGVVDRMRRQLLGMTP